MKGPIRVLVVEDSPVAREFLVHAIRSDGRFALAGTAADGEEALDAVRRLRPDVVVMDIHMPRLDGLEATRRIMRENPVPVVVVSGTMKDQVAATFSALDAGAVAFLPRPNGSEHAAHAREVAELLNTLALMSEVKVVRRRAPRRVAPPLPAPPPRGLRVVAIGASTGGPPALLELLRALGPDFPAPILIVQHMAEGFLAGFAEWLARASGVPVHLGVHGEMPLPGHAYVAPDGRQMGVDGKGCIALTSAPPENGMRPAVDHLLRSVRAAFGPQAAAVLLTGMGRDGAGEMLGLKQCGAQTFVQDRETSIVYGMPGAAIELDAARHVLAPPEIGAALRRLAAEGTQKP